MERLRRHEVGEAVILAEALLAPAETHEAADVFDVRIPGWPRRMVRYVELVRSRRVGLPDGMELLEETMSVAQAGVPAVLKTQVFIVNAPGCPTDFRFNAGSAELPHPSLLPVLQYAHANNPVIHQDQQDRTG